MDLGTFYNADNAYYKLVSAVSESGKLYTPRGKSCIEIRPASFCINDPVYALYRGKDRKLNYAFWAMETLGYLAGLDSVKQAQLLLPVNPNMEFVVNPETGGFDGAYGPYISPRLQTIVAQLRADPETRQAIIPIWHPSVDLQSRDVPCTISLQFFQEKYSVNTQVPFLSLHASMRSNDLNWGWPYDIAAFCAIQWVVCCALGWHIGNYYHTTGSLHYYLSTDGGAERPPKVTPQHEGQYYTQDALRIPVPYGMKVDEVRAAAFRLCEELIEYQQQGAKALLSNFNSSLYNEADKYQDYQLKAYLEHWLHLIKGTWRTTPLTG